MAKPPRLPPGMIKRSNTYYANFRQDGRLIRKSLSTNFQVSKAMLQDLRLKVYRATNGEMDNDRYIKNWLPNGFGQLARD